MYSIVNAVYFFHLCIHYYNHMKFEIPMSSLAGFRSLPKVFHDTRRSFRATRSRPHAPDEEGTVSRAHQEAKDHWGHAHWPRELRPVCDYGSQPYIHSV